MPRFGVPLDIAEVGPELALFAHRATAAPVVLASHWSAGAPLFLALNLKSFDINRFGSG